MAKLSQFTPRTEVHGRCSFCIRFLMGIFYQVTTERLRPKFCSLLVFMSNTRQSIGIEKPRLIGGGLKLLKQKLGMLVFRFVPAMV